MKRFTTVASLALVAFILMGCDQTNPVNDAPSGDLTISVTLRRDQSWLPQALGGEERKCLVYVAIKRQGVAVSDANVVVDGVTIPFEGTILKQYYSELEYSKFLPDARSSCSITIDGKTVTEEIVFKGDITATSGGSSVSWTHEGTNDFIMVQPIGANDIPSATETYNSYTGVNCTGQTDLSSPASIPAAAYPDDGTSYLLTTVIKNSRYDVFAELTTGFCWMETVDLQSVAVQR